MPESPHGRAPAGQLARIGAFEAVDDAGRVHEVEVWVEVTYSTSPTGTAKRSVGLKHLRMADSGNLVKPHLDGSLEDSKSGLRMRMVVGD